MRGRWRGHHLCFWTERGQHSVVCTFAVAGYQQAQPTCFHAASQEEEGRSTGKLVAPASRMAHHIDQLRMAGCLCWLQTVVGSHAYSERPRLLGCQFHAHSVHSRIPADTFKQSERGGTEPLFSSVFTLVQRCGSSRESSDLSCTHREDQQLCRIFHRPSLQWHIVIGSNSSGCARQHWVVLMEYRAMCYVVLITFAAGCSPFLFQLRGLSTWWWQPRSASKCRMAVQFSGWFQHKGAIWGETQHNNCSDSPFIPPRASRLLLPPGRGCQTFWKGAKRLACLLACMLARSLACLLACFFVALFLCFFVSLFCLCLLVVCWLFVCVFVCFAWFGLIWFGLVCLFVCACVCVCLCEVIYIFDRAVCTLLSWWCVFDLCTGLLSSRWFHKQLFAVPIRRATSKVGFESFSGFGFWVSLVEAKFSCRFRVSGFVDRNQL